MNNKHILLISYVFPPYPGIGGRRWAKMAKYLAREGYTVHVLAAENPFNEVSLWTEDARHERIHLHTLPAMYPDVLLKKNLSLWDKFSYRYWINVLSRRHPGSVYDRALAWQPVMHKKAVELIREHAIENVIATGAPFRALYYAMELKNEFSKLNVIADFRDPWTAGKSYGFGSMTEENMAVEVAMEKAVVENADVILAPAQEILIDLAKRYGHGNKFVHLPHAFDPDDYSGKPIDPIYPEGTISFAFTGTVYAGLDQRLEEIANMLKKLREENPEVYKRVRIDFYTGDLHHSDLFSSVSDVVTFRKPLPPRQLFETLRQYRYALVLFTAQYKDFLSTKFWELFHLRLPLLYIGPEGRVSEFLLTHDMGLAFTNVNAVEELRRLLLNEAPRQFRLDFDSSEFSCEALVRKLEEYLK